MKGIQVTEVEGKQAEELLDSDFAELTLVPIESDKVREWAKRNAPKQEDENDPWRFVGKR